MSWWKPRPGEFWQADSECVRAKQVGAKSLTSRQVGLVAVHLTRLFDQVQVSSGVAIGAFFWLFLLGMSGSVFGQNPVSHQVDISIPFQGVERIGYHFANVEVTRTTTDLSKPQTITIGTVLGNGQQNYVSVRKEVQIPAGSAKVSTDLVYYTSFGQTSSLVVSLDGSLSPRERRGLLAKVELDLLYSYNSGQPSDRNLLYVFADGLDPPHRIHSLQYADGEVTPRWRMAQPNIASNLPAFDALAKNLGDQLAKQDFGIGNLVNDADWDALCKSESLLGTSIGNLPESPVGLQSVDVMLLSLRELKTLATTYPNRCEAVRKWVAEGGRLIIKDVGSEYQALLEVLPSLTAHYPQGTRPGDRQLWRGLEVTGEFQGRGDALVASIAATKAEAVYTVYGLGSVVATDSNLRNYSPEAWGKLLSWTSVARPSTAYENTGDYYMGLMSVRQYQVPNVGEPPKLIFLGLISLFALLVGPVLFIWLNRVNRLNLLMFLIPALSLGSVFLLVLYVMAADGFDFRVSRISFTELDSANNVAVTQSLQAIYSGSSPRYYELGPDVTFSSDTDENTIQMDEGKQFRYSEGRIRVRTKHQVQTLHTSEAQGGLVVSSTSAGAAKDLTEWKSFQLTNQLGAPIKHLWFCGPEGVYQLENVAVDETIAVDATSVVDAYQMSQAIRDDLRELRKQTSQGTTRSRRRTSGAWGESFEPRSFLNDLGYQTPTNQLGKVSEGWSLMQNSNFMFEVMKVGEFYALTEESPYVLPLKPEETMEFQIHLLHGNCEVQ